ncbi:hypothetical protein [Microvirgula aerodenitrificans]|uniref:hypothetical protein n=1 Tax=Microvirgula aerodenitrificans TaxID=57480 RepID=UPI0028E8A4A0|nr:hypothetical protein [Microvirgula aerodenitrificans]
MKITLLCRYEHKNGVAVAGEQIEVSDDEARRLVDELGLAEQSGKPARAARRPAAPDPATDLPGDPGQDDPGDQP